MPFGLARVVQEGGARTDADVATERPVDAAESCRTACVEFNFDGECAVLITFATPCLPSPGSKYPDTILW